MATKKKPESALVPVTDYAILSPAAEEMREVMADNLGPQGIGEFDIQRIKVPPGEARSWEIEQLDGSVESLQEITGVIVAKRDVRAYWTKALDDGDGNAIPDCASRDGVTGQGDPGGDCATCPLAQFGTARDGRGQACSANLLLFTVRPGDLLPVIVKVPPSSLKAVRGALLKLTGQGRRYSSVQWAFGIEKEKNPDGKPFSKIVPRIVGMLGDEEHAAVRAYAEGLTGALDAAAEKAIRDRDASGDSTPHRPAEGGDEIPY